MQITFIILGAGIGHRMISYEPRSLLKYKDKYLISHQIDQIKNTLKDDICPFFTLVTGYKHEKVVKKLKQEDVLIVNNPEYDTTNQIESVRRALNYEVGNNVCLIHGDIFFSEDFSKYDYTKSFCIVDNRGQLKDREVGINYYDNKVNILSYGIEDKWAQIVYLTGKEFELLQTICSFDNNYYLTFEIINKIIDLGGTFDIYLTESKLFEVDKIKDLKNENTNS